MEEKYDGLLLEIARQHQGIEPILDTFFSFLRRKTDFFTGADEETVMKLVQKSVKKHSELAVSDRERKQRQREEEARRDRERLERIRREQEEREKEEPRVIELDDDDQPILPAVAEKASAPEKAEAEEESSSDPKEKGLPPNKGNGHTTNLYSWTQTLKEVTLSIKLSAGTKPKDMDVVIKSQYLKVAMKGQKAILEGNLPKRILKDESMWSIVDEGDHRLLNIEFLKENQMEWWNVIVEGEPAINLSKVRAACPTHRQVNPENSNLSDLDGEMRTTVEKMMFDQKQKELGLPTSDDLKKQEMLKKFMAQHPEMDFSKVKMS